MEKPLSKLPEDQVRVTQPQDLALAPLATPQEVVQSVDVGRRDPFAAVLTPRVVPSPSAQRSVVAGKGGVGAEGAQQPAALQPPKGFVFQGVLDGATGREALVEYVPSSASAGAGGVRSGSLRVGDVGSARNDSLLPPGWRVRSIDVARGQLELQSGNRSIHLEL
ncbi:MAG: hypothetical protein ACKOOH_09040 [Cyanobium sp.]